MKTVVLLGLLLVSLSSCSSTHGIPVDENDLGFRSCQHYYDCGSGRYCSNKGFCSADCRTGADCLVLDQQMICNRFGQCLVPDGERSCSSHTDCGDNRFCNGTCTQSGAGCGGGEPCPLSEEVDDLCLGTCGAHCGNDNDCLPFDKDLTCTPIGQCLQEGWEQWIDPGKLPPTACQQDSQCKALGWSFSCDCEKELNQQTGELECENGGIESCVSQEDIDFACGPPDSAWHDFCGVWGVRVVVATITLGVPIVNTQLAYSSSLFLVKLSHPEDQSLKMETKICDVQLINFSEDDQPFTNMVWMTVPHAQFRFLPIIEQRAEIPSSAPGAPFTTSQLVEVRGALLGDPSSDPLPSRQDFINDPDDARLWDQDRDGQVGVTFFVNGVIRGQVHNVIRWKAIYQGTILDQDHVRGAAITENEQNLISASSELLIYDTTTILHQDPTRTYFRMLRMDQNTSCAELIREAEHQNSWLRHTNHLMDVADP